MAQKCLIHKFGGTSVGSPARFKAVADIVVEHHSRLYSGHPTQTVVVVSAMSGVTNLLISGARAAAEGKTADYRNILQKLSRRHIAVLDELLPRQAERLEVQNYIKTQLSALERMYQSIEVMGEFTARGQDHVASFGELLSIHILAALLCSRGFQAQPVLSTQLIVTDTGYGGATPLMDITRDRLRSCILPMLQEEIIPVISGYIAETESGVTTTLGRGGSDYTAAIVGAGLDADEVWIWSDVDGILTADPHLVENARTLRELSYTEAAELAYYGANVLHPKTIRPVITQNIPLRILNSFNPEDPGTLIVKSPSQNRVRLPAIISTTGLSLVVIGSVDDSWSLDHVMQVLHTLGTARVEVLMFSQSYAEHSLNLIVQVEDQALCLKALQDAFETRLRNGSWILETKEKVATVSMVGVPGWNEVGTVSHAFAVLGRTKTRVIAVAQAATENSVSFCIPEEQVERTVLSLHRELELVHRDESLTNAGPL